jgi:hypothetical protein
MLRESEKQELLPQSEALSFVVVDKVATGAEAAGTIPGEEAVENILEVAPEAEVTPAMEELVVKTTTTKITDAIITTTGTVVATITMKIDAGAVGAAPEITPTTEIFFIMTIVREEDGIDYRWKPMRKTTTNGNLTPYLQLHWNWKVNL